MPPKKTNTYQRRWKSKSTAPSARHQLIDESSDDEQSVSEFNPGTNNNFPKSSRTTHQQAGQLDIVLTLDKPEFTSKIVLPSLRREHKFWGVTTSGILRFIVCSLVQVRLQL